MAPQIPQRAKDYRSGLAANALRRRFDNRQRFESALQPPWRTHGGQVISAVNGQVGTSDILGVLNEHLSSKGAAYSGSGRWRFEPLRWPMGEGNEEPQP